MEEARKEWVKFAKTAVRETMRPSETNVDNLQIADQPLEDNLGITYFPITGVETLYHRPSTNFSLQVCHRATGTRGMVPLLCASCRLVYRVHDTVNDIPHESRVVRHVGKDEMFWTRAKLPRGTPVGEVRYDHRVEHLRFLARCVSSRVELS